MSGERERLKNLESQETRKHGLGSEDKDWE